MYVTFKLTKPFFENAFFDTGPTVHLASNAQDQISYNLSKGQLTYDLNVFKLMLPFIPFSISKLNWTLILDEI